MFIDVEEMEFSGFPTFLYYLLSILFSVQKGLDSLRILRRHFVARGMEKENVWRFQKVSRKWFVDAVAQRRVG